MFGIFEHLGAGEKSPEIINVFVEITRGSQNKYEFDKEAGVFRLDRVLYSPMHYPLDYGFVPQTLSEDGDSLDVLILGSDPVFPGCVVSVRLILATWIIRFLGCSMTIRVLTILKPWKI